MPLYLGSRSKKVFVCVISNPSYFIFSSFFLTLQKVQRIKVGLFSNLNNCVTSEFSGNRVASEKRDAFSDDLPLSRDGPNGKLRRDEQGKNT